jgi:hypothetical protein
MLASVTTVFNGRYIFLLWNLSNEREVDIRCARASLDMWGAVGDGATHSGSTSEEAKSVLSKGPLVDMKWQWLPECQCTCDFTSSRAASVKSVLVHSTHMYVFLSPGYRSFFQNQNESLGVSQMGCIRIRIRIRVSDLNDHDMENEGWEHMATLSFEPTLAFVRTYTLGQHIVLVLYNGENIKNSRRLLFEQYAYHPASDKWQPLDWELPPELDSFPVNIVHDGTHCMCWTHQAGAYGQHRALTYHMYVPRRTHGHYMSSRSCHLLYFKQKNLSCSPFFDCFRLYS